LAEILQQQVQFVQDKTFLGPNLKVNELRRLVLPLLGRAPLHLPVAGEAAELGDEIRVQLVPLVTEQLPEFQQQRFELSLFLEEIPLLQLKGEAGELLVDCPGDLLATGPGIVERGPLRFDLVAHYLSIDLILR
jgi:hypothetical protein